MNTVPVSNAIADTFAAHLDALAAADPARALLIDPDGAVSAAERARAVAGRRARAPACSRASAPSGCPTAPPGSNPSWPARGWALALAVNTRFRALEVADILGRGKADWLIFWPGFKGIDFQGVLDDVPAEALARLRGVIAIDAPDAAAAGLTAPEASAATGDRHALPRHRYADLRACADAPPPAQANTGVLCFTTSGTTSRPSSCCTTSAPCWRTARRWRARFAYGPATRVLASAPFCGAFGFSTLVSGWRKARRWSAPRCSTRRPRRARFANTPSLIPTPTTRP